MGMNVRISGCFGGYNNYDYYRPDFNPTNSTNAIFATDSKKVASKSEPVKVVSKPNPKSKDYIMAKVGENAANRAVSQLGIRERTGNNDGRDIEKYRYYNKKYNNLPWCAAFLNWCYNPNHKPGENIFGLSDRDVQSSQKILNAAADRKNNCFVPASCKKTPQVGDALVWKGDDDPTHGHVCLVTKVNSDGSFEVVHGNQNDAVEPQPFESIEAAMVRINSEGESQTLQGFVQIPKYYAQRMVKHKK